MKAKTETRQGKRKNMAGLSGAGRKKTTGQWEEGTESIFPFLLLQKEKPVKGFSLDRCLPCEAKFGLQPIIFRKEDTVHFFATILAKPLEKSAPPVIVGEEKDGRASLKEEISIPVSLHFLPDGLYRLVAQVSISGGGEERELLQGSKIVQVCNLQDMIELRKRKKSPCGCD